MASRSVTTDIDRVSQQLARLTDTQVRYAIAGAMTRAVIATREQLKAELPTFIDRPTRWTINAAYAQFARPSNLTAEVGLRTDGSRSAGRYLQPLIQGTRPLIKPVDRSAATLAGVSTSAALVPSRGGAPINQYGNVSLSNYAKILGNARIKGSGIYVAPIKRGSATKGVFQRTTGFIPRTSTLESSVRRLFTIDPTPAIRQRRLPLEQILNQAFSRHWPGELRSGINAELRRAGFK
jgi:hypothetical protein